MCYKLRQRAKLMREYRTVPLRIFGSCVGEIDESDDHTDTPAQKFHKILMFMCTNGLGEGGEAIYLKFWVFVPNVVLI